ncbi:hypothetical protein Mapa_018564 [Marchantia paleacea]|nr:hypothetical protein Mapa_018564 [Marchantia paleacea]
MCVGITPAASRGFVCNTKMRIGPGYIYIKCFSENEGPTRNNQLPPVGTTMAPVSFHRTRNQAQGYYHVLDSLDIQQL